MEEQENESVEEQDKTKSETIISYHTEDFISKARISDNGTIPLNILEFDHSYGYDCKRRFNLCVADPNTLIFASGNLIHFFKVAEKSVTFRRCSTGGGIGYITKNPKFDHIAIGENGINPPIIIYEWPSFEIVTVLHNGTKRSYSCLRYSPDGLTLASQGGDPDYLITMWDWQRSTIALQCKSHGQDIYNLVFSSTLTGRIVTCGSGHIKSWKMAKTFTGLKLQGELGRFGKTEISDIESVYPMPDEKIISGCEWGNILVWSEGLIKIEVSRRNNKPCHKSYISQFEYIDGDLISVGTDGYINVWYYDTIDQATPTDTSNILEVEPIYKFKIQSQVNEDVDAPPVMLMQILRQNPSDLDNKFWYAQDGNGGIWLLDLSDMRIEQPSKKVLSCHAGRILDMCTCDWGPYVATVAEDSCLCIYNHYDKKLMLTFRFFEITCSVVWLPCAVESTGSTIICGFDSGMIRMIIVKLFNKDPNDIDNIKLIQVLKPHTMKINLMSINPRNSLLVTGSEDKMVFVFKINPQESYPTLLPIGYVDLPSFVTVMIWKPNHDTTLFLGCFQGDCMEVELPEEPQTYTTISYKLSKCRPIVFKFQSVKSQIIRAEFQANAETRKQQLIAEKREEIRMLRENNPGIEIDDEAYIESALEADAPLPEIYVPEVPNAVLLAMYTRNSLLLSMAEYDAGYVYEFSYPEQDKLTEHINSYLIADCYDQEIRSYLFYNDRKYIIFGMEQGEVRVCKIDPDNEADFSDYWILPMHDNFNGYIPKMCLSYNQKMLLTCGYDGNIFSFFINDDSPPPDIEIPVPKPVIELPATDVLDIDDDHPSLEQVIVQTENARVSTNAKEDKNKTLGILHRLIEEFNVIMKKNNNLPLSQRLTVQELEIDPRITHDLNMHLQKEMDLVHKKLEFNIEKNKLQLKKLMNHFIDPITCLPFVVTRILKPDTKVNSLRELKLTGDYAVDPHRILRPMSAKEKNEDTMTNVFSTKSSRTLDTDDLDDQDDQEGGAIKMLEVESFLRGLSPRTIQYHLGDEVNHLLKRFRSLKKKLHEQDEEWKILESKKPDPTAIHPEDEAIIQNAHDTIGDFKLKASLNFNGHSQHRVTVVDKYQQLIECRRKIHFRREDFNKKLRDLRTKKVELQSEVNGLIKKLKNIHSELPVDKVKPLPIVPTIDYDLEYPEKNLEIKTYVSMEDRVKESKKKKQLVTISLPIDDFDEEYEVLLLDTSYFRTSKSAMFLKEDERKKTAEEVRMVRVTVPSDVVSAIEYAEKVETKIEREMKLARAARKIHEQDQILDHIHKSYQSFDEQLDELEIERFIIVHESVYMDLFLLTLHQELLVLKKFENIENNLTANVNDIQKTKNIIVRKIKQLTRKIDEKNQRIIKIQDKINEIVSRYISSIKGDKYYKFLKKICKKKYRPPRPDDASSSSSSDTSSSSSEEEQVANEDSDTIEAIHVDENVCPADCSREIYDEAFIAREKRYEKEFRIQDEQRSIDTWQKELDAQLKRHKEIEVQLAENYEKLNSLLSEKQSQLNDIDVTVLLRLQQIQSFRADGQPEKIQDCIIFDKNRLSQLYRRVGELQKDTDEEIAKYKDAKVHLRKLKLNLESMKNELEVLKGQIKKEMQQKFGQQVSLVSLYEAVLQRMIYDIKANTSSLIKFYDDKIKSIKSEYTQQLQILRDLIHDNTEKLSFLTVLEEELLKLRKTLNLKLMSEEQICELESEYLYELDTLKRMLRNQKREKERLSRDIQFLSNKSKNLLPVEQLKPIKEKCRPALKVFDGIETRLLGYGEDHHDFSDDGLPTTNESEETLVSDSSQHKKMIAIRHMLSQVTTQDEPDTKGMIDEMLVEFSDNVKQTGYRPEKKIVKTIEIPEEPDEVPQEEVEVLQEGLEIPQGVSQGQEVLPDEIFQGGEFFSEQVLQDEREVSQEVSQEILRERQEFSRVPSNDSDESIHILYCYDKEPTEASILQEMKPEVRSRMFDMFSNVGIQGNVEKLAQDSVYKLKMTEDVNYVSNYILQKLSSDVDDETKVSHFDQIKQTLEDVMKLLEINGIEAVEHEDKF